MSVISSSSSCPLVGDRRHRQTSQKIDPVQVPASRRPRRRSGLRTLRTSQDLEPLLGSGSVLDLVPGPALGPAPAVLDFGPGPDPDLGLLGSTRLCRSRHQMIPDSELLSGPDSVPEALLLALDPALDLGLDP